jgi:signal peptidase II
MDSRSSGVPSSRLRQRWPYLLVMAIIVVADQITKALVDRFLTLHESVAVVDGLVDLTYVRNRGAAFGLLSDARLPYQSVLLGIVGIAALVAIVVYAVRLPARSWLPQTALALVMGGAVGNLVDRVRHGFVIDFVDVYWGAHHWPAFNVADSAISVGVALLILDMITSPAPRSSRGSGMAEATSAGSE